ncbi:uncharacterized protein MONOS_13828 [Monocercomonoides exilis]|uniref:uncharacterized protein n=1 Tax=Monocercomonoides exilis TaxID=2049356 RepID=UPI003559AFA8|nr:hypothetical protein MONOS_13828 [Monocercomonoides exilis]|eukprot:MONOS_13828.1-p1 / transcript=MONOS_13828.1 / gene=MONOS_13828 / organism=Monocercomonoides_exilis_PA203 / gene_product=unspecified product / transcript_product=unspecified product / location=Mono_scaffold00890:18204-18619(+) / protein_length=112 / sequence_SO=supercontig / SO=protein_coding / is_pseudo=false
MEITTVEACGGETGSRSDGVRCCTAISLAELEEREEAEEGEREGAEGGDGTEEKGGYRTAHRDFVERIKENKGKLEEAIAPLVVEALGLSGLRFVKAETHEKNRQAAFNET